MGTIHTLPGSHPLSKGSDRSGPSHAGFFGSLRHNAVRLLTLVWKAMVQWQRNQEERIALKTMDDRILRDIGLNRGDTDAIAQRLRDRPFHRHY